jgi:hypothetical protein
MRGLRGFLVDRFAQWRLKRPSIRRARRFDGIHLKCGVAHVRKAMASPGAWRRRSLIGGRMRRSAHALRRRIAARERLR